MRKFVFKHEAIIPKDYRSDVDKLVKKVKSMSIDISDQDAYRLWDMISDSYAASWLGLDAYSDSELKEMLLSAMDRYGALI